MLFNSLAFVIFLPIVWIGFHSLRSGSARACWLLAASYVFYMWWRIDYAVLLVFSTVVDYGCGLALGRLRRPLARRLVLLASVSVNLGLLVTFKYWGFLVQQLVDVGSLLGARIELPYLDLLLPIGISFYTFQTISYTVEVYRGRIDPETNPIRFALYVSFFPQLVAGPIERPDRLLPQLARMRSVDAERLVSGFRLILWGMFKKVVVADRLAIYVDIVYGDPSGHHGGHLLLATAFFSMQIYCDFSGYSDIAIGCARTLGIDLMRNFRRPYLAWCPSEFWRRWHISLSTWFRDYVYIPLGGSRGGVTRAMACLLVTFLISGLWHGANWTFVVWGGLHGGLVLSERLVRRVVGPMLQGAAVRKRVRWLGTAVTIPCICVAWVFFRADSLSSAWYIVGHLFSDVRLDRLGCGLSRTHLLMSLVLAQIVMAYDLAEERGVKLPSQTIWEALPIPVRWCGYWGVATCILLFGQFGSGEQFIYFQF